MDFDIDFDFPDLDFNDGGCSSFAIPVIITAGVISLSYILAEHWIFIFALGCLALTILFGVGLQKPHKKHEKPRQFQGIGVLISTVGFLGLSIYGICDYQEKRQIRDAQKKIEAEEAAKRKAEEQKNDEETRRIGALGRFKRWAFGEEKTD